MATVQNCGPSPENPVTHRSLSLMAFTKVRERLLNWDWCTVQVCPVFLVTHLCHPQILLRPAQLSGDLHCVYILSLPFIFLTGLLRDLSSCHLHGSPDLLVPKIRWFFLLVSLLILWGQWASPGYLTVTRLRTFSSLKQVQLRSNLRSIHSPSPVSTGSLSVHCGPDWPGSQCVTRSSWERPWTLDSSASTSWILGLQVWKPWSVLWAAGDRACLSRTNGATSFSLYSPLWSTATPILTSPLVLLVNRHHPHPHSGITL